MLNPPTQAYQGATTFGGGVTQVPKPLPAQAAPQAQANNADLMAQMQARRAAMMARRGQHQQMFGPRGGMFGSRQQGLFGSLPQLRQGMPMGGMPQTNPIANREPLQQIAPAMPTAPWGGQVPQMPGLPPQGGQATQRFPDIFGQRY
jgi:hypothetical protein